MIDVGGPAILRAAAKNYAYVTPVCRPRTTSGVLDELRSDGATLARDAAAAGGDRVRAHGVLRRGDRRLARRGARRSRRCSSRCSRSSSTFAYGENPHQRGAYYAERGSRTQLLSRVEQLHGRELSFNNLNDLNAARLLVREFALAGVRDRQAREPVRRRRRDDDRGGVRARARRRSALGVRRRRRAQPPRDGRARRCDRGAVRRGAVRPRLRRGGARRRSRASRRRGSWTTPSGAPASRWSGTQARPRRAARAGPRLGDRRPRGDAGRDAASRRRPSGTT